MGEIDSLERVACMLYEGTSPQGREFQVDFERESSKIPGFTSTLRDKSCGRFEFQFGLGCLEEPFFFLVDLLVVDITVWFKSAERENTKRNHFGLNFGIITTFSQTHHMYL